MADDPEVPRPFTLKRWSSRKLAAARAAPTVPAPTAPEIAPDLAVPVPVGNVATTPFPEPPLPPIESLDFDSDYSVFMQPKVDESTQRAALKKLFSNPSFNVMDGLDIYVGDYTQADPMPAGMLEKLSAVYAMLDPVEPPPDEAYETTGDVPAGAAPAIAPGTSTASASESATESDRASAPDCAIAESTPTRDVAPLDTDDPNAVRKPQ